MATPTGLPSRRATPTSRSAPGASGTKASSPLTSSWPSCSLACGAGAALEAMARVRRPLRMQVVGRAHRQVGGPALAAGELGEHRRALAGVVEDRARGKVPEQVDRRQHPPALAHHQHRVEGVEARSAVGLVDQQPRPAGLDRRRPQVRQRRLLAVERLAGRFEGLEARQRPAGGLAQEFLLVRECQVHAGAPSLERSSENGIPLSSRGSGGRPRTRSPTVLRRISSVPPADFRPGRNEIM